MSTTTTTTTAQPITTETILRLFPDIDTRSEALTGHDEEQIRLMDEVCLVLDENDSPIGTASKKICESWPSSLRSLDDFPPRFFSLPPPAAVMHATRYPRRHRISCLQIAKLTPVSLQAI
jgi:hypothetical protein